MNDISYQRNSASQHPVCFVMPPYMAEHLRAHCTDHEVISALDSLKRSLAVMRKMRAAALAAPRRTQSLGAGNTAKLLRRIFDCKHSTD